MDNTYDGLPTIVVDCSMCGDVCFGERQDESRVAFVRKDLAEVSLLNSNIKGVLKFITLQSLAHLPDIESLAIPVANGYITVVEQCQL